MPAPHIAATSPAEPPKEPTLPGRMQCPHCGMWVSSDLSICSTCRLDMRKQFGKKTNERDEEMRSNVKFSLIGIGVTLVAAPLFFMVAAALVCMLHVGIPVVPSILISLVYNIVAGILTVVWAVILGIVFAGYLIATQPDGAGRSFCASPKCESY